MSAPFVAEIRIFALNFAPRGWAMCNGQILAISQNTALFSLVGTTYGGNGQSNFALPNLQGQAPLHQGQGPGLSQYSLGETGGTTTVTLNTQQIPQHNHTVNALAANGNSNTPVAHGWGKVSSGRGSLSLYAAASNGTMAAQAFGNTGSGAPHNNMPPYLTLNFCIALQGIFPPRS